MSKSEWCYSIFDSESKKFRTTTITEQAIGKKIIFDQDKILCVFSKDLPVVHLQESDDSLIAGLAPFQICHIFKEKWINKDIFCYHGIKRWPEISGLDNPKFICSHYSSLLNDFWLEVDEVFHVDFENQAMHVFVKKNNEFVYYNKLIFENEADVHYNLLMIQKFVFEKEINPVLTFSGEMDKESRVVKTLKNYYSQICFLNERMTEFTVNDQLVDPLFFDKYLMANANHKRTV